MRVGCAAYSYRQYLQSGQMSLEQFVQACREMGLDGVELTSYYFKTTQPQYLYDLKRLCFAFGLNIAGTAVGSNFTQADAGQRRLHVEMTKHWIDNSVILGAPCIRVFAGPVPKDCTEEQAFNWAVECLREVAAYGQQKGVVVALENHGGITSTAEQVLKLLGAVNNDWLGVNLDFGNFRQDPYAEFEVCAPYAVTTHAKTHHGSAEGPVAVDYARVVEIMRNAGYKGYITIEYEGKEEPRVAVPQFAEQLLSIVRSV